MEKVSKKKTNKLITDGETWTEVIIFYEGKSLGGFFVFFLSLSKQRREEWKGNCILINNSSKTIQDVWDASAVKSLSPSIFSESVCTEACRRSWKSEKEERKVD
jgi:hypothetical protein